MKELKIYIPDSKFKTLAQILENCQVEGFSYYDVMGQGKLKRDVSEKIVQGYRTNEKFIPEFARRTKVETIVPDTKVEEIVNAKLLEFFIQNHNKRIVDEAVKRTVSVLIKEGKVKK